MSEHTPGQWIARLADAEFIDVEAPFEGDVVGIVATCPTGDYGRKAAEANARLIAAAPDLLDAARLIAKHRPDYEEDCDGGCVDLLRDAIAKVEGRDG